MSVEIAPFQPGFLTGLRNLSLDDLRDRRTSCSAVEVGLSCLRRMVQGRLDIVLSEVGRREAGGAPVNVSALVEQLPQILSDHVHAPGVGRLPTLLAPAEVDQIGNERLEQIVSADHLARLDDLSDEQLTATVASLHEFEREVSDQRRALHDVMDRLQEEVVRRYKSGEASVDTLLR